MLNPSALSELYLAARELRRRLEPHFCQKLARPGTLPTGVPSKGMCGAVSVAVCYELGAEMVSTTVNGESHWFNRLYGFDFDLTADQFGMEPVAVAPANELHGPARQRVSTEVADETLARAAKLLALAGGMVIKREEAA